MTVTVNIDSGQRTPNGTYAGFEAASGPVEPGDVVHVVDRARNLWGGALVTAVDEDAMLIYLSVAWDQLSDAYSPAAARRIADRLREGP